ncbi:MAG: DUF5348 domain-containing protein [Evtepia sp.]|nr:DUF5348 domain-containing protein [Evtepia sp.]
MPHKEHPMRSRKAHGLVMPTVKKGHGGSLRKTSFNILLQETAMTGILILNQDRPDIALDNGTLYGGLHCGDCFRCLVNGTWMDVRLEYDDRWILIYNGTRAPVCYGVRTQI